MGANIIAIDMCAPVATVPYPLATREDLRTTELMVQELGCGIICKRVDVRDFDSVQAAVKEGLEAFGGIDIVVANAGVLSFAPAEDITESMWDDVIDINLKGVWHTCKAVIPTMKTRGSGGSIIIISSVAGFKAWENQAHYVASKHGVIGLMRTLARELAPYRIRVNTVHPTSVLTDMIDNEALFRLFLPDHESPTRADVEPLFWQQNSLPLPWVEPRDISNAVAFLASDAASTITGITLPVDAGTMLK
jgi:SDR family mycofactocin-dependent oxidoreductase